MIAGVEARIARAPAATRLDGIWLLVARAGWLVLAALAMALFVAGMAPRGGELQSQFQRHIGMNLTLDRRGDIVASPWSGGSAAQAGILERDVLVNIDGIAVHGDDGLSTTLHVALGALGTPVRVSVRTGERPARQYTLTLGGDETRALARFGLSYGLVAAYASVSTAASATISAAIAALIFWRKASDWLAMLVSAAMLALVAGAAPVIALYRTLPALQPVIDLLFALALVCLLMFFFVFPDGRFVPYWTRVPTALGVVWLLAAPLWPQLYPWRLEPWPGLVALLGGLALGVSAQVYRYWRVATPVQRQQTKWIVYGAGLAAIGLGLQLAVELLGERESSLAVVRDEILIRPASQLLIVALPVSMGVALFRYRLWDVDVLINRTLVYGLLTISVAASYALVVAFLGGLLRIDDSPLVSLLAASLVAVLFHPLRERLQRAVNRMLYGERDDPYTALSSLGRRLGATLTSEAILPAVVADIRTALRLPYAAIALRHEEDDNLSIAAASGEPVADLLHLPLRHQTKLVGDLCVGPRGPGERWSPADRRLLDALAEQAGAAVHAVRMTTDLQRLSTELQQARERLVLGREDERRRLRRDLHDELAPNLAALGLTAAAMRDVLKTDPAAAATLLAELHAGLRSAVGDIRRIAYELRPPVLDELGLVAAIRQRAARYDNSSAIDVRDQAGLQITVDAPDRLPLLPAAVEVAAYRIVQEALMNIVRHARAGNCLVRVSVEDWLVVEVLDDGIGVAATAKPGIGLRSMRERATELGGSFAIERRGVTGTRLLARLPLGRA